MLYIYIVIILCLCVSPSFLPKILPTKIISAPNKKKRFICYSQKESYIFAKYEINRNMKLLKSLKQLFAVREGLLDSELVYGDVMFVSEISETNGLFKAVLKPIKGYVSRNEVVLTDPSFLTLMDTLKIVMSKPAIVKQVQTPLIAVAKLHRAEQLGRCTLVASVKTPLNEREYSFEKECSVENKATCKRHEECFRCELLHPHSIRYVIW